MHCIDANWRAHLLMTIVSNITPSLTSGCTWRCSATLENPWGLPDSHPADETKLVTPTWIECHELPIGKIFSAAIHLSPLVPSLRLSDVQGATTVALKFSLS